MQKRVEPFSRARSRDFEDCVGFHQPLRLHAGVIARALGAVAAVFASSRRS